MPMWCLQVARIESRGWLPQTGVQAVHWQQTQKTPKRSNARNKAGFRGLCAMGMFILGKITTSMGLEVRGVRSVNSASQAKLNLIQKIRIP